MVYVPCVLPWYFRTRHLSSRSHKCNPCVEQFNKANRSVEFTMNVIIGNCSWTLRIEREIRNVYWFGSRKVYGLVMTRENSLIWKKLSLFFFRVLGTHNVQSIRGLSTAYVRILLWVSEAKIVLLSLRNASPVTRTPSQLSAMMPFKSHR